MTDLNLDGLPDLQAVIGTGEDYYLAFDVKSRDVHAQLRQLVERERERLPAWAKPVMRAARKVNDRGISDDFCELEGACDDLTEEQKEEVKRD